MLTNLRTVMTAAKDRGASAVEYGLMVAAIAAVIVGIVFGLGTLVGNTFNDTCSSIANKGPVAAPATGAGCPASTAGR